jgi:hypothetical protein
MRTDDSIANGCMIPLGQALVTGVLCGLAVLGVGLWLKWTDPWAMGLIAAGGGAVLWWVSSILLWREAVYMDLRPVEPVVVEAMSHTLKLELYKDKQITFAELPVTFEEARKLAQGLLAGIPFSEAGWIGDEGIFSRSQFVQIRGEFVKRGWARWRNDKYPPQGVELLPDGWDICKQLARGGGQ